jgi:hypothetical protein
MPCTSEEVDPDLLTSLSDEIATLAAHIHAANYRLLALIAEFDWLEGYGAFTGSPSQLSKVQRYIDDQVEHHRKKTFEEETWSC